MPNDKKEEDIFDPKNIPQAGWWKTEKPGDRVSGTVLEIWEQDSQQGYPARRCFALKQTDGSIINVGLKRTSKYLMQRTINVKVGDILGVEYSKDMPSVAFKGKMAKSIVVYVRHVDTVEDDGFGGL